MTIITICWGMQIHLSCIFMWTIGVLGFEPYQWLKHIEWFLASQHDESGGLKRSEPKDARIQSWDICKGPDDWGHLRTIIHLVLQVSGIHLQDPPTILGGKTHGWSLFGPSPGRRQCKSCCGRHQPSGLRGVLDSSRVCWIFHLEMDQKKIYGKIMMVFRMNY